MTGNKHTQMLVRKDLMKEREESQGMCTTEYIGQDSGM